MRALNRFLLVALAAWAAAGPVAGCSATREALLRGGPKVEVHIPPSETIDIGLRTQAVPRPPEPPPFAVTDEDRDRGRWLTLFQMDINPSETAGVPPAPAESP